MGLGEEFALYGGCGEYLRPVDPNKGCAEDALIPNNPKIMTSNVGQSTRYHGKIL